MRILHLVHEYPPLGGGGGIGVQNLVRLMGPLADHVIITSGSGQSTGQPAPAGLVVKRIRVTRMSRGALGPSAWFRFMRPALSMAGQIIHTTTVDLVHSHFAVPAGISEKLIVPLLLFKTAFTSASKSSS